MKKYKIVMLLLCVAFVGGNAQDGATDGTVAITKALKTLNEVDLSAEDTVQAEKDLEKGFKLALAALAEEKANESPNFGKINWLVSKIREARTVLEPAADGGDSDEDGTEGGDADDSNGRYEIEDALESLEAWDVSVDDIKTAKDALANGLKLAKAALAKEEDKKPIWRQDEQLIADLEKAIKDAEDASVLADEGEAEVSDVADEGEAEVSDTEDKVISEDETPVEQEVDSNTGVQGVITNVGEDGETPEEVIPVDEGDVEDPEEIVVEESSEEVVDEESSDGTEGNDSGDNLELEADAGGEGSEQEAAVDAEDPVQEPAVVGKGSDQEVAVNGEVSDDSDDAKVEDSNLDAPEEENSEQDGTDSEDSDQDNVDGEGSAQEVAVNGEVSDDSDDAKVEDSNLDAPEEQNSEQDALPEDNSDDSD
eukprot:915676_1